MLTFIVITGHSSFLLRHRLRVSSKCDRYLGLYLGLYLPSFNNYLRSCSQHFLQSSSYNSHTHTDTYSFYLTLCGSEGYN